jgi:hypothetical protein
VLMFMFYYSCQLQFVKNNQIIIYVIIKNKYYYFNFIISLIWAELISQWAKSAALSGLSWQMGRVVCKSLKVVCLTIFIVFGMTQPGFESMTSQSGVGHYH